MRTRRVQTPTGFAEAIEMKIAETGRSRYDVAAKVSLAIKVSQPATYKRLNRSLDSQSFDLGFALAVAAELGLKLEIKEVWS